MQKKVMTERYDFSNDEFTKMLRFFPVVDGNLDVVAKALGNFSYIQSTFYESQRLISLEFAIVYQFFCIK